MKILDSKGPIIDPCGTPDLKFLVIDLSFCMPTLNFLFARYECTIFVSFIGNSSFLMTHLVVASLKDITIFNSWF